ncbi:MAG TPA: xanthine dehydrogenase family protein molybdopterin-binding subunit [Tepidisphaeraceae bacterium]|jgi:xanthine dehydrogenase YagR molybdenum-binding subunit|nr:xanthine dehydrogenase family protein molybdopterin-binding subunit [Tepidisphaeraceae bacterium]
MADEDAKGAATQKPGDTESSDQAKGEAQQPAGGKAATQPTTQKANPQAALREQQMTYGIVGTDMKQVTRRVPMDEPPPLGENATLKSIGKSVPRLDAVAKVTGKAKYTFDIQLPGMLWARRVVSPWPHAKVLSVDTSAAEKHPGVKAVHVLERVLQTAQLRDPKADAGNKYPTVRYAGQPIAAVAATSARAAEEAAKLVKIEYEQLPHVTDLDAAMKEGSPVVFPGPVEQPSTAGGGGAPKGLPQNGNVRGPNMGERGSKPSGDTAKGFDEADVIVQGEFRTQVQTHVPMETHGLVADWRSDGLTIYASTQHTNSVRDEAAEHFDLPKSKIRVISDYIGGGFGAKYGINNFGLLAIHLSRKAKAPVRMMLDRREEHTSAGNRPSSYQKVKIGAKKDGTLTAIHVVSHGTGGVAGGAGIGFCYSSLYPCQNVHTEQYDVFTNAGPCAAFRAPGQAQGIFSLEQVIDEVAHEIGIDPLAYREKIDTDPTDDMFARAHERKVGAERIGWANRKPAGSDAGPIKRGMGFAQSQWLYLINTRTNVEVRVSDDGSVAIYNSTQDIGTGTRTVMAQTVAEEFGLKPEEIGVYIGDTRFPFGPPSGGSQVTSSVTPAARNAAYKAARELAAKLAGPVFKDANPDDIIFADGKAMLRGDNSSAVPLKEAAKKARFGEITTMAGRRDDYEGFAIKGSTSISKHGLGGVQFADITVDTETGVIKVNRIVAVHDCGRPINPMLVRSQIEGGVIQGISYAIYEDRILDPGSGHQLNANVDQYKIVGSREMPQIDVVVLEQLGAQSSTDARGIAEASNVAVTAAIGNAFFNATGKRIRTMPMNPANVLAALKA